MWEKQSHCSASLIHPIIMYSTGNCINIGYIYIQTSSELGSPTQKQLSCGQRTGHFSFSTGGKATYETKYGYVHAILVQWLTAQLESVMYIPFHKHLNIVEVCKSGVN